MQRFVISRVRRLTKLGRSWTGRRECFPTFPTQSSVRVRDEAAKMHLLSKKPSTNSTNIQRENMGRNEALQSPPR
jgi:hypothetical protein